LIRKAGVNLDLPTAISAKLLLDNACRHRPRHPNGPRRAGVAMVAADPLPA
jgi:hypothetical protein